MSERFQTLNLNKVSRDDLIYLAGLIDGDGCFLVGKRTIPTKTGLTNYMLKLQIHCINEPFIDDLHRQYGGVKIIYRKKAPRRWLYGIEFTGKLLTQMCELLIPHLKLKKQNAENLLVMRKTYNGTGGNVEVPQHVRDLRDHCFEVSRQLNTHKPFVLPPCCPSVLSSEEFQVN